MQIWTLKTHVSSRLGVIRSINGYLLHPYSNPPKPNANYISSEKRVKTKYQPMLSPQWMHHVRRWGPYPSPHAYPTEYQKVSPTQANKTLLKSPFKKPPAPANMLRILSASDCVPNLCLDRCMHHVAYTITAVTLTATAPIRSASRSALTCWVSVSVLLSQC